MIEVIEEIPYGSLDISNINVNDSIPISVEVVPHKAYLIEEEHSNLSTDYLNFQIFRLTENTINRDIIRQNRQSNHRENTQNLLKRIKCILYTMVSIPITILLLGYVSTLWNRR
jgi:hypothetical protein